ncbi:MAG: hypothetical protein Satyrvirus12_17 [Satyrvirus sp.]|uniref:Uncharacterized protein n=1 Tax=Satyrvirus sp. TaxID=2487771 RepID=A0A3G5AHL3_9VIRU|nr:MAG: hypothetical protein Satyrvirus12_17 [Satyrvirus sp.]
MNKARRPHFLDSRAIIICSDTSQWYVYDGELAELGTKISNMGDNFNEYIQKIFTSSIYTHGDVYEFYNTHINVAILIYSKEVPTQKAGNDTMYHNKYLKYKNKYLSLKTSKNQ